jgi:hypothetical protein
MAQKTNKKPPAKIDLGSMRVSSGFPKINLSAKPKVTTPTKKVETKKKVETNKKVENKKFGPSLYDTKVKDQYGKPVVNKPSDSKKKPYGMASKISDEKKVVKKVETKKVVAQKPEVKKAAPERIKSDLLDKMTKSGNAFYYNTKTGKFEANSDLKTFVKKIGDSKKEEPKKVETKKVDSKKQTTPNKPKVTGNSFLDIATGAKSSNDYSVKLKPQVVNNNLTTGTTVSQLWKEKTGTSWSEAKSLD